MLCTRALGILTLLSAISLAGPSPCEARVKFALTGLEGNIEAVAYSADGRWLAAANSPYAAATEEFVQVWDVAERKLIHRFGPIDVGLRQLAFSQDRRYLAGTDTGTLFVWDLKSGASWNNKEIKWDLSSHVYCFAFSPDGKQLASAYGVNLCLIDIASKTIVRKLENREPQYISALEFSPNGKQLASGGYDGCHLWDVATGELKTRIESIEYVSKMQFSADGSRIMLATEDVGLHFYDLKSGHRIGSVKRFLDRGYQHRLAYSETAGLLFGSWATCLRIPAAEFPEVSQLKPSGSALDRLRKSSAGPQDISVRFREEVPLLHESGGVESHNVRSVAVSPDGKQAALGCESGEVLLWDIADMDYRLLNEPVLERKCAGNWTSESVFTPDGESLLVADGTADESLPRVTILDTTSWELNGHLDVEPDSVPEGQTGSTITVSPDGRLAAMALGTGHVYVWNLKDGTTYGTFPLVLEQGARTKHGEAESARLMAGEKIDIEFLSDSRTIAVSTGPTLARFDVETGKLLPPVFTNDQSDFKLCASSNGKWLAAILRGAHWNSPRDVSGNPFPGLWSAERGEWIKLFGQSSYFLADVAISSDGRFAVASMTTDNTVDVFDTSTGKRVHHLEGIESYPASISPDGLLLLAEDTSGNTKIWNLQQQRAEFTVDTDPWHIAWAPRGDLFAARGGRKLNVLAETTLQIWRAEPYPHVSYRFGLPADILLGVSRILNREGFLADEVGVETYLGRDGDQYFLAFALPGEAHTDPAVRESLGDLVGAAIAKEVLPDGLTIMACDYRFVVQHQMRVSR